MLRVAGIVALFVLLTACGGSSAAPAVSPSTAAVASTWAQDLTLRGDVSGHMTGIVADNGDQQSACTGAKPRAGQTWADEFFGQIDESGDVWGIDFVILNYGGPGVYRDQNVAVEVHDATNPLKVWENQNTEPVTFVLDHSQQSGTVDALLTNADSGKSGGLHLTGHWNCKA